MAGDVMLGRDVRPEEYGRLDTFLVNCPTRVTFQTEELQAVCPAVVGVQPDIYHATISYLAVTDAIESKSLKLWLTTFRNEPIFAEHLAVRIYDHLTAVPGIAEVEVILTQNMRGGIVTTVEVPG